jgi:hypothetical protein
MRGAGRGTEMRCGAGPVNVYPNDDCAHIKPDLLKKSNTQTGAMWISPVAAYGLDNRAKIPMVSMRGQAGVRQSKLLMTNNYFVTNR